MRRFGSERGIAMVVVLLLMMVALAMTGGLLYMLSRGGYMSAMERRYKTALDAGIGGADVTVQLVAGRGLLTMQPSNNLVINGTINTKLDNATATWAATVDRSVGINADNVATYDARFDLGDYRVFMKIVDTVQGNSGADEGLLKSGVVNAGTGELVVVSMPYLYSIEILSQNVTTPSQRAKLSVLYEY